MRDTTAEIEAEYRGRILALSPARRLTMACRMYSTGKALVRAGLLKSHGTLDAARLREEIFFRFYGRDFDDTERERILEHLRARTAAYSPAGRRRRRTPP